jgi:hypothetical protein
MSVLNRPSSGLPNVLIVLYRSVLAYGPLPRSRLLSLCGPLAATAADAKMPQKTLTTWRKLGLFEIRDDDTVRLSPALPAAARDPLTGPPRLPDTLRDLVFRPENNANLWGKDDGPEADDPDAPSGVRAADFTRGACWCLALSPRIPREATVRKMWDGVDTLQQSTLEPGYSAFVNDTRWAGFAAWAPFLGFGWSSVSRALVVDPTQAIMDYLPEVFGDELILTQKQFIDRLAARLPVLDGGTYRLEVEAKLLEGRWEPPGAGVLSATLSAALERLSAAGVLELEVGADVERKTLTGPSGKQTRTFARVIFRGAAS